MTAIVRPQGRTRSLQPSELAGGSILKRAFCFLLFPEDAIAFRPE